MVETVNSINRKTTKETKVIWLASSSARSFFHFLSAWHQQFFNYDWKFCFIRQEMNNWPCSQLNIWSLFSSLTFDYYWKRLWSSTQSIEKICICFSFAFLSFDWVVQIGVTNCWLIVKCRRQQEQLEWHTLVNRRALQQQEDPSNEP